MNNNFFQDTMKMFTNNNMWQNFNFSDLMNKNVESVSAMSQAMARNAQNFSRVNNDMMQQFNSSMMNLWRNTSNNPETFVEKQQDFMKEMMNNFSNYSKEYMSCSSKAMSEFSDLVMKKTNEGMQECMSSLNKQNNNHSQDHKKK